MTYKILRFAPPAWAIFHVLATVMYLLPPSPLTERMPPSLRVYMASVFSQNWHFFAPTPGYQGERLWVGCADGDHQRWVDPVAPLISKAATRPFGPHGKLTYIHRQVAKSLFDAARDSAKENCAFGEAARVEICESAKAKLKTTRAYQHAHRYALDHCQMLSGDVAAKADVMGIRKYPFPYSKRDEFGTRPYYRVEYLRF